MGGKAKFQKHTAKELNAKQDQKNKGGGSGGVAARTTAKLNFTCDICMSASPDIKSYEAHYSNKHPKATFDKASMIAKAEALRDASQDKSVNGSHHKKK
uniref:Uncharacterized protein n=1 Tax=Globisporangium ultimum (strain ATCC 200006 / CBS 805.95 / DAOM BR144) TaxID=431595 RepID=K3X2I5_GLOUD